LPTFISPSLLFSHARTHAYICFDSHHHQAKLPPDQISIVPLAPASVVGDPTLPCTPTVGGGGASAGVGVEAGVGAAVGATAVGTVISRLQEHDASFRQQWAGDVAAGKRIRFVGTLQFKYEGSTATVTKATIEPMCIGPEEPLFRIQSKEVFVALSTEVHHAQFPLTMYGAGQGGVEGASALLSDVIRIGQHLRS
jgi:hypothetical protein